MYRHYECREKEAIVSEQTKDTPITITIHEELITEQVSQAVCLEAPITAFGRNEKDIYKRIGRTSQGMMNRIWRSCELSKKSKQGIHETMIGI